MRLKLSVTCKVYASILVSKSPLPPPRTRGGGSNILKKAVLKLRKIIQAIDNISEYSGRVACWICAAVILVLVYEVTARYVFDSPTIWAHQFSCMLGATLVCLGWAYTHRHHGHVRIDIIYNCLPPRGRAAIDVFLALLLLFPLLTILIISSLHRACFSWEMKEVFIESFWRPPAGPFRTVMFLGICLFTLQGLAEFIRDLYFLIRNKPL